MPAIEIGPGQSVPVAFPVPEPGTLPEPEGTLVTGHTCGGANALVVLAEG